MQRRKLLHSSAQKGPWPQGGEGPHGLCMLILTRGLEGLGARTVPQLPLACCLQQPHLPCPCLLAAGSATGQQGKAVATAPLLAIVVAAASSCQRGHKVTASRNPR